MQNFKKLFEYGIFPKGNSLEISYYTLKNNDITIAAYIYKCAKDSPRVVIHKVSYRNKLNSHNVFLESGRYQVKFFVKNRGDTKYFESFLTSPIELKVLKYFLPKLYECNSTEKIIQSLVKTGLNEIDFKVIVVEKHKWNSEKYNFFFCLSEAALKIISTENCTYETAKFLFNCIFYIGNKDFLLLHERNLFSQLIINKFNQARKDVLFWFGLMQHKLGRGDIAYSAFSVLLSYKSELDFHQTGALSYLSDTSKFLDNDFNETQITYINKSLPTNSQGCILVSCDFGYFSAYLKNILHTFDKNLTVHLHLILPGSIEELNLSKISEQHENIFVSYELIDESIGNFRTYYSVSRYLILPEILNRYNLPTIVADADLDFLNIGLISVVTSVNDNEFALNIKDNDLPWLRVTAGFNVFGKHTGNANFFNVLIKYIKFCFQTGRDGWMLDQTALGQCLYFYNMGLIKSDSDFEINKLQLEKTVRQITNRAKKRVEARQALSNLRYN
ncbi:hypothetical protein [Psychrobacter sp. ASPA161_6]|uniref:hypothetical protein n=1 Tax=Psychrobacter sp. ASPA161_6 TaxID=3160962 RepID=UPI003F7EF7B2